jgi:uncharacterized protein
MQKPMFEMLTGKDGKIYFHLRAANGTIVLSSHGFQNKVEVIQGIARVMRYGAYESRFLRLENALGQFSFELRSPSGRTIGLSETYLSKQGRDNGIVAVRRSVQFGRVLDLN